MKLLLAFILVFATAPCFAKIKNAPFIPEVDKRFDALEVLNAQSNGVGLYTAQMAHDYWDYSVGTNAATGAHTLSVTLPANAIIRQAYTYSVQTPATSSSATLALSCGSATILTAANVTSYTTGNITAANQTGTAATMSNVGSSACVVTATVASGPFTAGKLDIFVEYVIHQ